MHSTDYKRVAQAIGYLEENYLDQPSLDDVAAAVGLSPTHFQRLFKRWAGISPKRFVQFLTIEHAKSLLDESRSLLDLTYASGLSGPGRLHDLFIAVEAMSPGEYKLRGEGLHIRYGFHDTPFGECLIGVTDRGICHLEFVDVERGRAVAGLRAKWTNAKVEEDPRVTAQLVDRIFGGESDDRATPITLLLAGTNFQVKVWEALLRVPSGAVTTYEQIAETVCTTAATRAVGGAVSRNAIAFLIPCHRVIRKTGVFGGYRWGLDRKRAMLGWESAQREIAIPAEAARIDQPVGRSPKAILNSRMVLA